MGYNFNGVSGCGLVDFEKGVIKLLKKKEGLSKERESIRFKKVVDDWFLNIWIILK